MINAGFTISHLHAIMTTQTRRSLFYAPWLLVFLFSIVRFYVPLKTCCEKVLRLWYRLAPVSVCIVILSSLSDFFFFHLSFNPSTMGSFVVVFFCHSSLISVNETQSSFFTRFAVSGEDEPTLTQIVTDHRHLVGLKPSINPPPLPPAARHCRRVRHADTHTHTQLEVVRLLCSNTLRFIWPIFLLWCTIGNTFQNRINAKQSFNFYLLFFLCLFIQLHLRMSFVIPAESMSAVSVSGGWTEVLPHFNGQVQKNKSIIIKPGHLVSFSLHPRTLFLRQSRFEHVCCRRCCRNKNHKRVSCLNV